MSFQSPGGNLGGGSVGPTLPRGTGFAGSRGTSALLTQVLVAFITQYHRGGVEQLSADLKKLQEQATRARQVEAEQLARVAQLERASTEAQTLRLKIAEKVPALYEQLAATQKKILAQEADLGAATTQQLTEREEILAAIRESVNLDNHELYILRAQGAIAAEQVVAQAGYVNAANNRLVVEEQVTRQLTIQQELLNFGSRAAQALRNIAVAAVGATVGAAIIGPLIFDQLNAVMDEAKQKFTDLVDPAEAAKEAVVDLGKAVDELASSENISRLDAAAQILERLSKIGGGPGTDSERNTQLLQLLAVNTQLTPILQQQLDLLKAQRGVAGGITAENRDLLRQQIILEQHLAINPWGPLEQAIAAVTGQTGALVAEQTRVDKLVYSLVPGLLSEADALYEQERAAAAATAALKEAADAYAELAQEAREAAINASFDTQIAAAEATRDTAIANATSYAENAVTTIRTVADAVIQDIQSNADERIGRLQSRITAIGNRGPSERTNDLAAAVERLNKAEKDRQFNAQLADIQEQKSLLLLRQRLALTDEAINLDDYQGKARLVAIDALLDKMRRQNEEQDRFNKLLDIQYQISQGVRRQQGETIADFISRRAQYYRGLLEQAADLQRKGPEAELKAERDRVQATLELRELEDRRTELLRQRAHEEHLKRLQEELKASQEADKRAAQSAQERLRQRIDNIRQAAADEIKEVNRTRDANIAAANHARDVFIADQKARTDAQIEQLKQQREDTLRWTNAAESTRYAAAVNGAENIAQLNAISGRLAGANFSVNYVRSQLQALGFKPGDPTYDATIKNFENMLSAYQSSFYRLSTHNQQLQQPGPTGWGPGVHAEGGIIPLTNSLNLSNDIRIGERGPEGGLMTSQGIAVLNNEIMSQLRERDRQRSMFEGATFNVQGSGDPYGDRYQLEQMMRRVAKEVLN